MNRSVAAVPVWICARTTALALVGALGIMCAQSARAAIILDPGFFTGLDPSDVTLVTFDDRAPANVADNIGQSEIMPLNAYSDLGVSFTTTAGGPGVRWVHDGSPDFSSVRNLNGLGDVSMLRFDGGMETAFDIHFSTPVLAFGMWVIHNNNPMFEFAPPTFTAFDDEDTELGSVALADISTESFGFAEYAFMGLSSGVEIARVRVTTQAAIFDHLYFTPIPGPGPAAALLIGAGALGLRRRRSAPPEWRLSL